MVDVPDAPTHDNGRAALSCVLVDDHPAVLDAVSRFLESNGIAVVAALSDGRPRPTRSGDYGRPSPWSTCTCRALTVSSLPGE